MPLSLLSGSVRLLGLYRIYKSTLDVLCCAHDRNADHNALFRIYVATLALPLLCSWCFADEFYTPSDFALSKRREL